MLGRRQLFREPAYKKVYVAVSEEPAAAPPALNYELGTIEPRA
jgi:hypothetical protein